ncbi:hypothetical protein Pcinc_023026 [Petrolisthes cinctipes]|uniref:Uncharacterized protein n=1 Tax=Petrolisthes cinctipes TaxID=88211 RepID=A0AAE1KGA9_PETCI|nr:hypothetical protein Pcinc_023026 [Petrolisthes cinctipes]
MYCMTRFPTPVVITFDWFTLHCTNLTLLSSVTYLTPATLHHTCHGFTQGVYRPGTALQKTVDHEKKTSPGRNVLGAFVPANL